jgi:hypothetical protein
VLHRPELGFDHDQIVDGGVALADQFDTHPAHAPSRFAIAALTAGS